MVNFIDPFSVLAFIIIQLFNIFISYRLSELITSLLFHYQDIPKLTSLKKYPPVALLYVTYNDALEDILKRLKDQTYKKYDTFILDDSTDESKKKLIDKFGYNTVRRKHRKGFKAGALNHWLNLHGKKYKYLIILDSDSILKNDFIEEMLKYAEHSMNQNVAFFQSKWRIWNTINRFTKTLAAMLPLQLYSFEKLANEYETPLFMGHNNLLRIKALQKIGGFDEVVCEDLATALHLIEEGYECKYVDVISYEAAPENVDSYVKRHIRWAMGTIEVVKSAPRKVSFLTNLHLFMAAYSYLIYFLFIPGMILVTIGFRSSFDTLLFILQLMISGEVINTPIFVPLLLVVFYSINFLFIKYPLAIKLGVSSKNYFLSIFLSPALDFYAIIPLLKGLLSTIFGKKVYFNVTKKDIDPHELSLFQIIYQMKYPIVLSFIILLGITLNPIALIFNFFWIIPFLVTPFVIYSIQKS